MSSQSDDSLAIKEIDSLIQVSRNLTDRQNFDKALEINIIAEKLVLKIFGRESISFGNLSFNYGRILFFKRNYVEAEKWYLESKAIREKLLGIDHADYGSCLNNLGLLYYTLKNYQKAEQYYFSALNIREKALGKDHIDYIGTLINLGILFNAMEDVEGEEQMLIDAKGILELQNKYANHPFYSNCLLRLGVFYTKFGNFKKAEFYLINANKINLKLFGKDHPSSLKGLLVLAHLYEKMHIFKKSELLLLEALDVQLKLNGMNHFQYVDILKSLANFNVLINNNENAEFYYLEAKSIADKIYQVGHPEITSIIIALGNFYFSTGFYEKAEKLLLEAKKRIESDTEKVHYQYANILIKLGDLYFNTNRSLYAEQLYIDAKNIYKLAEGNESNNYVIALSNLANYYRLIGNYEEAISIFIECKIIMDKVNLKNSNNYIELLSNLGWMYEIINQNENAEFYFREIEKSIRLRIFMGIEFLSEMELDNYIDNLNFSNYEIFSFVQKVHQNKLESLCYNNILLFKEILLNTKIINMEVDSSNYSNVETLRLIRSYEKRISSEYSKPNFDRDSLKLTTLETKLNELYKELAIEANRNNKFVKSVSWIEVQRCLKVKDVSIEFVNYRYFNLKQTDSIMYAALVLLPNDTTPHFVPLFEEGELNELLSNSQSRQMDYVVDVYHEPKDKNDLSKEFSKSLYELIWKPLEPYLKGVNKIYFSPSGLLHRINQNAIAINDQSLLSDNYDLVQLTSTRQLVTNESNAKSKILNASIYGGINFEMDSTSWMATHHETDTNGFALRSELSFSYTDSTLRGGSWKYLSGSEREVNDINKIINKAGIKSNLFKGNEATEEAFKKLGDYKVESPQIIHISTHGYFFPDPKVSRQPSAITFQEEPVFKISEHPMLRSGLIMAGANHAWKTGKPITPEAEDGILTAYEISQLNLRNTELVVLSACETGLGDIQGNEGVYGLQRAFKIAGAKNLIMSLWQVPDQQTSELMTAFYKYWLIKKKSIRESLKLAQNDLRKKGLESFYWAGFVLVE